MAQPPTHNPWKNAAVGLVAGAERVLRRKSLATPEDLRGIRNFLFLQYEAALGSVIHATPVFAAIKRVMPDAHISVAASGMAASVLGRNPYIDRCVLTPNPFTELLDATRAARFLADTMPPGQKCVVTTIGNQRTRVAMVAMLAGSVRAGYTLASGLYDVPLNFDPERGQIEGNLDIVRALGHPVAFSEPEMFFENDDVQYADRLLGPADGRQQDAPRIVFVTQNSRGQKNQWIAERFQQVVSGLVLGGKAIPVFVGTASDAQAIEILRRPFPNAGVSLAGKTTVPQLAAVLAQCDLIVSLDTGTFHVARAVGLPGVVIAPAWQSPLEWLPVGDPRYRVLRGASIAAPAPDYCIEEIGVEQVIGAALDLLKKFPPELSRRAERVDRSTAAMASYEDHR